MNGEYFDWVKARADCSIFSMFEKLKLQVQQDIVRRQSLEPKEGGGYLFRFTEDATGATATAERGTVRDKVSFHLTENVIEIKDKEGKVRLGATATLSDDRECLLVVDGKEREMWQIRKAALEPLFFRND
jgi:hypothetical protein